MGGHGSGRKDSGHSDSEFYQHWGGKRTKMADILTQEEIEQLDEVAALTREDYDGPELGTQHEYPPARAHKASGHEPPDWLIEHRRLERASAWLKRDLDHARAMALDQAERERTRYRAAPDTYDDALVPRHRTRSVGITVTCEGCGHRGRVVISPGMQRPWRLRCSKCGERHRL